MTAPTDASGASALAGAQALADEGDLTAALEVLLDANRRHREPEIERALVRLRHDAFLHGRRDAPPPRPAGAPAAVTPGQGLLTVTRDELTPAVLGDGIRRHGCVHVRGLVDPATAAELVAGTERAFDALAARQAGTRTEDDAGWYEPFRAGPEYKLGFKRKWIVDNGGVWTADSPAMLFTLLEVFREAGVIELVTAHLGERPALSVNKSTLKRIDGATGGEWHQDGAFLGSPIPTVNVWLSLSRCGREAPGLDLVPRRIDHVLETGTHGAAFDWAVGPGLVQQLAAETPVLRPEFEAGDALLFDELFLHRTAAEPTMPHVRHAIESWFFAPSGYPEGLVPLLV
jgi:hypothetical protein